MRGPGGFEPAEVDREAEGEEDQEVAPVAGLVRVGLRGLMHEEGDCDGKESVEEEPVPAEVAGGEGLQECMGRRGQHGQSNFALVGRACMCGRRDFPKKAAARKGDQGEDGGDHIGRSEHAWALV